MNTHILKDFITRHRVRAVALGTVLLVGGSMGIVQLTSQAHGLNANECKKFYPYSSSRHNSSSVHPICKPGTPGSHYDVKVSGPIRKTKIIVNNAWRRNIVILITEAGRAGFYLHANTTRVSSYRSEATQQWLRVNGYPAARSVSMHQWGLAVDFSCRGGAVKRNGVKIHRNAQCLKWMRKNAPKYGVYQLPSEPWHWSSNGR